MVGGRVAHVHTETGGRVSYKPYRAASARLLHLLKSLTWAAVVEKASIDEAFILLAPAGPDAAAAGDEAPGILPQVAMRRAHEVQAAARKQLGLAVSVGAAPNRLLAKLASAAAKLAPAANGIRLVADQPAALQLLAQVRLLSRGHAHHMQACVALQWWPDASSANPRPHAPSLAADPCAAASWVWWQGGRGF